MTEKQFERAVEIHNRIEDLELVKEALEDAASNRLSYACKRDNGGLVAHSDIIMGAIDELLDRHDAMIRQEIDDEIRRLKDEIRSL